MTETLQIQPWDRLAQLIAAGDDEEVRTLLGQLPSGDVGRTLSRLTEENRTALLLLLGPEAYASLIEPLSGAQTRQLIEELSAEQAAAIVEELPSAEQADVLGDLATEEAAAILHHMPAAEAETTRQLLQYPPDSGGGLMITEYLSYGAESTVGDVVEDMIRNRERYYDYDVQYCYITGPGGRLAGVLRLRDLLMVRHSQPVSSVMRPPLSIDVAAALDEMKHFFDDHPFVGAPVTDRDGVLLGVVRRSSVVEALGEKATEVFLAVSGLIREDELRTMPVLKRARRRLSWLSLNILLNVLAASVIAFYQDTLAAVIALAVFLPIISDMSGCSGNQAVAVSIRELTLGLVRPYEFLRVVGKEGAVGLLNGLVLGLLLGTAAVLWKGNIFLGLVVGTALMFNTLVAVVLGGLIPLALRAAKQDPALASGPILTTVTDMVGFFLVLSFASVMLGLLV
ncbi:MAG: magnesium transporter [Gemmatimonadota bacterium]|nr:MAG: magnesium transporter [Gemmatimonadota bacterium]